MAHEVKCADTVRILTEWNEDLETHRMSPGFDAQGIAIEVWALVEAFIGDWQPVSAATQRAEAGLSVRSKAVVFAPCNLNIEENDRVYRPDGTFMYVNYAQIHEDHAEIYLTRDGGSQ